MLDCPSCCSAVYLQSQQGDSRHAVLAWCSSKATAKPAKVLTAVMPR
jgi:hypothetical protein